MATEPSPEASEIRRRGRRRLLGAVTLVLLLVVFVPMILDSEPRQQRNEPALAIPPKENVAPLPAPTPAATPAPQAAATPPPQAATPPPQAATPSSQAPATPSSQAPATRSSQAPATPPSSRPPQSGDGPGSNTTVAKLDPAPKLEGFAVQVGAFRDEAKLKQARAKLEAAGVVHYTERIDAKGGPMTRLRAGPFPTREAADAARARLQRASIDGKVVSLP